MDMDLEKKVEPGLVLGSKQDMVERKKDTEGMVTVGSDRSAKAVVSIGQYHGRRLSHFPARYSLLYQEFWLWWEEEQVRQEDLGFSPLPVI